MKWAKTLAYWPFYVEHIDDHKVCLWISDEEFLDLPRRTFIRMFGRERLEYGVYGTIIIKRRADGTVGMRGWPYIRRWTAEEIAEARRQAEELYRAFRKE